MTPQARIVIYGIGALLAFQFGPLLLVLLYWPLAALIPATPGKEWAAMGLIPINYALGVSGALACLFMAADRRTVAGAILEWTGVLACVFALFFLWEAHAVMIAALISCVLVTVIGWKLRQPPKASGAN